MTINFEQLRVGDLIKIPFLPGSYYYVVGVNYEKKTFDFASFSWLFGDTHEMSQNLVKNFSVEIVGVVVPKKYNFFTRWLDKMLLQHSHKPVFFTEKELRLMELVKN